MLVGSRSSKRRDKRKKGKARSSNVKLDSASNRLACRERSVVPKLFAITVDVMSTEWSTTTNAELRTDQDLFNSRGAGILAIIKIRDRRKTEIDGQ